MTAKKRVVPEVWPSPGHHHHPDWTGGKGSDEPLRKELDRARRALRNVLALSHRIARTDEENAAHLRRFCAEAGVVPEITRLSVVGPSARREGLGE